MKKLIKKLKDTQARPFWFQIWRLFFLQIFACWHVWGCWFQIFAIVFFKFQSKKTKIRHLWFQTWEFLFLHKNLHFGKLEVLISNIAIVFENRNLKNTQIRHFGPKFKSSCMKLCTLINWRMLVWNMTIVFFFHISPLIYA